MGLVYNRSTEIKCPSCGGNCRTRGGYLAIYKEKTMHRQYRECLECKKRITTYKDLETNEVFYEGKLLENTSKKK